MAPLCKDCTHFRYLDTTCTCPEVLSNNCFADFVLGTPVKRVPCSAARQFPCNTEGRFFLKKER